MATASAPGKVILFGEHAVVYGQPAIAVPLQDIRADATITPLDAQPGMIYISAPDIEHEFWLHEADEADALAQTVRLSLSTLGIDPHQSFAVHVTSSIPVASGMGSGAAVSVAVIRAMLAHFKLDFRDADISAIAYEVEKIHHGTPSGIDNTVVCYEQTVYFQKGSEPIFLELDHPFSLVIANTGVLSSTARAVGNVRSSWSHARVKFDDFFERIGEITKQARTWRRSG
jgi:mevalonate kinase